MRIITAVHTLYDSPPISAGYQHVKTSDDQHIKTYLGIDSHICHHLSQHSLPDICPDTDENISQRGDCFHHESFLPRFLRMSFHHRLPMANFIS